MRRAERFRQTRVVERAWARCGTAARRRAEAPAGARPAPAGNCTYFTAWEQKRQLFWAVRLKRNTSSNQQRARPGSAATLPPRPNNKHVTETEVPISILPLLLARENRSSAVRSVLRGPGTAVLTVCAASEDDFFRFVA